MKRILLLTTAILVSNFFTRAQNVMSLDECMAYAVENSTRVKTQEYTNDNYRLEKNSAIASFFPTLSSNVGGSANFGRSIDPETNTYTTTTNYSNSYSASTQMPLFAGLTVINSYRASKVAVAIGREDMERIKDEVALDVMQAYFDVVYYTKAVEFSRERLEASRISYDQGAKMEELGLKSRAELLQLEAQVASDDHNLTIQENNRDLALIVLKEKMSWPVDEGLAVDANIRFAPEATDIPVSEILDYAMEFNPKAQAAKLSLRYSELNWAVAKGNMLPSVYLSGNAYTSYYYDNITQGLPSFGDQFKNKLGYSVGASLSIPIFNGLNRRTSANRYRNQMRIAEQNLRAAERSLQTEVEQNYQQMQGYGKEYIQATKKVNAASLAHDAVVQKYEQGLVSVLELQTSANMLLDAQSQQLKSHLQYIIKCRLMEYYRGEQLIK